MTESTDRASSSAATARPSPRFARPDAEVYDSYVPSAPGELDFYVEKASLAGSPVLELGCGTGRIIIRLAEAGLDVVGIERDEAMLSVLEKKLAKLPSAIQGRIQVVQGDMREFSLSQRFPVVLMPAEVYQYLTTVDDQKRTLARIRNHLAEHGLLVFTAFDPRLDIIAARFGPLGTAPTKLREFTHPTNGNRVIVWLTCEYSLEHQIAHHSLTFEEIEQTGCMINRTHLPPIQMRYSFRYETQHLLELCGFRVEALYGDFRGGRYYHGSEQVWLARRV